MCLDDTIAAISTPIGHGGIGIVRISGPNSFEISDRLFSSKKGKSVFNQISHSVTLGTICDFENNLVLDEVLLLKMSAPNTYTKEDVVEINCHGGCVVTQSILELVLKNGARLAENGEFTKRAFLNGRIDLIEAEAVIDVISAKTNLSAVQAVGQLEGRLSGKIKALRDKLLSLIAHIEVSIDYPDEIAELHFNDILNVVSYLIDELQSLIATADSGRVIRDGIKTVILGRPNVGKSSLLNAFLNEDRAIVTDIPGTTRDTLEEFVNINGVPLLLVDTAGIRDSVDVIEQIGIEKAKSSALNADLVLCMLDSSVPLSDDDFKLLDFIRDSKCIVVLNKVDLPKVIDESIVYSFVESSSVVDVSLKLNLGVDNLKDAIIRLFFTGELNLQDIRITKIRHKNSLLKAINCLNNVLDGIKMSLPVDLISIDLTDAYSFLGELTGESLDEDIIDKIFSEFCLGK